MSTETELPVVVPDEALHVLGVANTHTHSPRSYVATIAAPVVAAELRRLAGLLDVIEPGTEMLVNRGRLTVKYRKAREELGGETP